MKKVKMTTEEHIEVGEHLRQAEQHIQLVIKKLIQHYYKSGKIMKTAYKFNERNASTMLDLRLLLEKDEGVTDVGQIYFKPFDKEVMDKILY